MFELVLTSSTSLDEARYVNLGDTKGHKGTVLQSSQKRLKNKTLQTDHTLVWKNKMQQLHEQS